VFREGQEGAIRYVVEGHSRLLVVQKTGWGKSFVYFIATKLLREAGLGPALLFSPLLSLMRNRIAAAERMGVRAIRITSDNRDEWEAAEECLRRNEVDILLVSPERLGNERFRIWGDAGWGGLVSRGKNRNGRFADELIHACPELIAEWSPHPTPAWVTCIPSRRHPELVRDFAERLAVQMELPFRSVLEKTGDRAEQKSMANSTQQARNVDGTLAIFREPVPAGPVLMVDDMVGSRWTLTVAAWLLRSNGSGEVWPLALAFAGHGR